MTVNILWALLNYWKGSVAKTVWRRSCRHTAVNRQQWTHAWRVCPGPGIALSKTMGTWQPLSANTRQPRATQSVCDRHRHRLYTPRTLVQPWRQNALLLLSRRFILKIARGGGPKPVASTALICTELPRVCRFLTSLGSVWRTPKETIASA